MKYHLSFVAFIAIGFAAAEGIQGGARIEKKRSESDLYSVPVPDSVHIESYPAVPPLVEPTDISSDDSCSTALTTITTTRTVSVITQIPSSLASVTGTVDLSSSMPSQSAPSTSETGLIELTTWLAPQSPSGTATDFVPAPSSVASDGEESSAAPPYAPAPSASDTTTATVIVEPTPSTTSASGLPGFTDAAGTVGVPVMVAGVLGWMALVL
ncbi:hypothetical protein J4E85_003896 [Alternaria conjuncta]|uniref:uncharacterized protein n=1 Tax=Alternaria conjuncta TaxID=181017 RepID=UPI00222094C0|nr:uncharacterized protein J4E85_003896 [Alternaria conjuncta]KAI4931306.1 hypothetical protein J4E85_003896 [Alternaria conjuncta]